MPACLRLVPLLALALLLTGCVGGGRQRPGGAPPGVPVARAAFPPADVLRSWDRARAAAFAAGDVAALRSLYVDGSAAGTSDTRTLRDYLRRGFRVEGMRMQLLALEVLHQDPMRLRLLVTDRLTGAVAVGTGSRLPLPQDQASTRVVELGRESLEAPWRVALVRASSRRPAAR